MKSGLCAILCFLMFSAPGYSEPLVLDMLPSDRVRDDGNFLSSPVKALLSDSMDSLSKTTKVEFYVVILQDVPVAEASKLCDRWQMQWVPKGQGGVFVYSVVDKKYSFTPTADTLETLGADKLQDLFQKAVENPPLRESLDVVIATPIFRIESAINHVLLDSSQKNFEEADSQTTRWEIIAGILGALAVAGWVFSFSKMLGVANRGSGNISIPPPGMAYRNPPRRSRSSRRGRSEEEGGSSKRDRF